MAMLPQEPQPPPTKPQPYTRNEETGSYKGVEYRHRNLKIKKTLTGALKPTEAMLSMPREDKTSLQIGVSVDVNPKEFNYGSGTTRIISK